MGTLTATPTIVSIFNVAAGPQTVSVTTTTAGPITASLADGSFVSLSPASIAGTSGTFMLTPTNVNGGDDVLTLSDGTSTVIIPVALGSSAATTTPTTAQNTLQSTIAYIRQISDSPTSPSDANIGILLNQAIMQISDNLAPNLQTVQLPIAFGSSTVTLPADVGDIEKILYNTGDLNNPGSISYELIELGPALFSDFNAGVNGSYGIAVGGPTLYYTRLSDASGRIRLQLAPYPPPGYLVLTYHPRLSTFDLGAPGSILNMDPSYLRLVSLLTAHDVCLTQRDTTRASYFMSQYNGLMGEKKISLGRRDNARTSVVRDVVSAEYAGLPTWWP